MTITHLGHACVLYSGSADRVLIDPGTLSSFADLRDLTAVLVTHEHADHVDVPAVTSLLEANPSATLVCGRTHRDIVPVRCRRPRRRRAHPGIGVGLGARWRPRPGLRRRARLRQPDATKYVGMLDTFT